MATVDSTTPERLLTIHGVDIVCVLDPERNIVTLYRPDHPEGTFTADDTLTLPGVLEGFSVQLRRFFE